MQTQDCENQSDDIEQAGERDRFTGYLYISDLRAMFRVGESKARLMMDALPSVRIGNKDAVLRSELDSYIAEHGGISVKWPKRRR